MDNQKVLRILRVNRCSAYLDLSSGLIEKALQGSGRQVRIDHTVGRTSFLGKYQQALTSPNPYDLVTTGLYMPPNEKQLYIPNEADLSFPVLTEMRSIEAKAGVQPIPIIIHSHFDRKREHAEQFEHLHPAFYLRKANAGSMLELADLVKKILHRKK